MKTLSRGCKSPAERRSTQCKRREIEQKGAKVAKKRQMQFQIEARGVSQGDKNTVLTEENEGNEGKARLAFVRALTCDIFQPDA